MPYMTRLLSFIIIPWNKPAYSLRKITRHTDNKKFPCGFKLSEQISFGVLLSCLGIMFPKLPSQITQSNEVSGQTAAYFDIGKWKPDNLSTMRRALFFIDLDVFTQTPRRFLSIPKIFQVPASFARMTQVPAQPTAGIQGQRRSAFKFKLIADLRWPSIASL